ncbi:hypothetical protein M0R45_020498 [Rubus argutus]|uniref:DUF7081 domain-containing protein n=1 Tax=Rubus argutus TaxID=59490 RepID=A0AAW1X9G8_RUBAR
MEVDIHDESDGSTPRTNEMACLSGELGRMSPVKSLCHGGNSSRKKYGFASKLAVERYIQSTFPGTNLDAFFASFSWKIPAEMSLLENGVVKLKYVRLFLPIPPSVEIEESDSQSDTLCCKARNKLCISLLEEAETHL